MKPFAFHEPQSVAGAIEALEAGRENARLIAGGSDLLGQLKDGLVHYERLVSLGAIEGMREFHGDQSGLRIGAGATLARLEHEPLLTGPYSILAEAARGIATPEIRNQGTVGGNLCQRPRCLHYRSNWISCLKKGGADCPAVESSHQQYLSVFGGAGCFSVHASDLAPPLLALHASAVVAAKGGERTIPLSEFFAGPEQDVRRENTLSRNEVLTAVVVPAAPEGWRGAYLKFRERNAGDFPLVSVAFGCSLVEGKMQNVRMVLGAVSPMPRPCPEAEAVLEGQRPAPEFLEAAANAAFAPATPLPHNGFKVEIGRALVLRAMGQVLELDDH
ncbi:MAG: FAD binding domain-containing protein [SAR324 cluster bacterium]|nr:FAD binding domain-containing protein [SAR324 cluster bacterium]